MTITLEPTATPPPPLFLWFGASEVGREQLLMVLLDDQDTEGIVHRPLLALDAETAARQQDLAQAAADELGVTAVLREYEFVSIVDRLEPQS